MLENPSFRCTVRACGQVFASGGELRRHVRQAHPSRLRLSCPQCGEQFNGSAMLSAHMETHVDADEVFSCPVKGCARTYTDVSQPCAARACFSSVLRSPSSSLRYERTCATSTSQGN